MITGLRHIQSTRLTGSDANAFESAEQLISLLERRNKLAEEVRLLEIKDIRHHHTLEAKAKYLMQTRLNQSSRGISLPVNWRESLVSERGADTEKEARELAELTGLQRNSTSIIVCETNDDSKVKEVAALRDLEDIVLRQSIHKEIHPVRDITEDDYLSLQGKDLLASLRQKARGKVRRAFIATRRFSNHDL